MEVITRSQWGARSVSLSGMAVPQADVFIHHTADGGPGSSATQVQEASYMRNVEAFHINSRGMRAIAYNFIVMPSGRVYEGRGWAKDGGHTACCNTSSHAVCFAGNFQSMKPTDAAIASAREVIALGRSRGFISTPRIRGHRDVGSTACPGNNLYARLDDIREGDDMTPEEQKMLKEAYALANALRKALGAQNFGGAGQRAGAATKQVEEGGAAPVHKHGLEGMTGPAV